MNATTQVGGAIGLAVLATLATERTDGLRADGESVASALNSGYHLAYVVGAVLVAVGFLLAVAILRSEPAPGQAPEHAQDAEPAYVEA